ncbi:unnamed protein product, partial [Notodromas monacha]
MSLFAGVPLHRSDVHISDSYANFLEDLWQCESAEVESVLSEEEIGTWDDPRCETFLSCETSNSAVSLIPGIGELQWLFRNDVSQPSLSEALASESSNLFPFNDVDLEVNLECSENPEDNVSIMCHDAENLDELIPAWHSACVRLGRLPRQDFSLKLTKSLLMKLISEGAVGNVTSPFAIDLVTGKISTRGLLGGTVLSPEAVTNALASIFELGNAVNQLASLGRKLHKRNVGSHHSWNRVLANVGFFVLKYVCAYRELSCIDLPHEINGHILEDNSRGLVEWKISATLEKIECFGRSSSLLSSIILDLMSRIKKLKITTSLEVIQFLCNAVDRSYVSSERWVAVGVAKFAIDAYMSCLKRGFVEGIDLDDLPDKFTEGSTSCEIIKKLRATVSFKDSEFLNAALRLCAETVGLMKRANTDFETIRELQTMDFAPCYTFLDLSRRKRQLAAFEDMACAEILSVKDQLEEDRRKLESQWAEVIASIEDRSIAVLREIREFQRQESEKIYERKRIVFEQAQAALETYQVELRRRKEEEVFLELKAAKERAEMDAKRASREAALKDEIIAKYSDKNDEMDEETRKMKWREKRLGVGGKKVLQPDQAAEFFSGSLETLPQWARKGIADPAPVVVKERPLWDKVDGPTEVPQVRLPKWAADHVTVEPFDVESFENRAVERVTNRDKVMGTDLDEILQHSDAAVFGKGRSLEDAKICEPSAAENLGNQSKDEALCKFLSLDRTESNSGKIFEMLETMELPRDVSWDDPSVTGSDLSISIKDPETGSAEDGYKRYYEQKLGIPAVEDACLFSSLIFQSIAVEAKLRLTLVDRAFVSWILNKSGAGVLKKLESVWTLFFLQDPYVSSHLARTLRDEEYCQKWYSKGRSVYGVPEPVFSHVLWQEALESSVDCDSYTDCASTFKFAIQQPPLYKGDCERLPNAVLNCSPAWPLDLLLTPENLEKYNRVFVLLLRLKIISENLLAVYAALKQLTGRSSRDAKNTCAVASNPEYRSFLVQRLEMSHFVSALMQFFESQQIRACLQEFKENLMNEVLSWRHFIHLHSEMVDRVHYRCLLGNDKRSGYLL